jgi:hypothetical protein
MRVYDILFEIGNSLEVLKGTDHLEDLDMNRGMMVK